jgi:pimeloyl-ACP methyl ester carboxylesterase
VSRVRHKTPDADYQGIILINPGGLGVSGLGLSTFGQYVPNGGGDAYDRIGFDPRGVGTSKPAVSCIADYTVGPRPEYIPVTRSLAVSRAVLRGGVRSERGAHCSIT